MDKTIRIYTGPNCHLCEQAKAILYPLLSQQGWELVEMNIHEVEDLSQRYGTRIPVVVLPDGSEKDWPFTAVQIGRMLKSVD